MNCTKSQIENLRAELDMPEDISALASLLRWDLYEGTADYSESSVQGFESGVRALKDWCHTYIPSVLWLDLQSDCWLTEEPEPWTDDDGNEYEPDCFDYIVYERRTLVRLVFGRELAEYL